MRDRAPIRHIAPLALATALLAGPARGEAPPPEDLTAVQDGVDVALSWTDPPFTKPVVVARANGCGWTEVFVGRADEVADQRFVAEVCDDGGGACSDYYEYTVVDHEAPFGDTTYTLYYINGSTLDLVEVDHTFLYVWDFGQADGRCRVDTWAAACSAGSAQDARTPASPLPLALLAGLAAAALRSRAARHRT